MVAALETYFDLDAAGRIRALWDAMEDVGIPSLRGLQSGRHRPHLSLAAAPTLDPVAVTAALADVPPLRPMRVRLDYIGIFVGRVLWLGPQVTADLLAHQQAVHDRLEAAGIAVDPMYRPGTWVPHVTVSMRVPLKQMPEAIRLCLDMLPVELTLTSAAVADYARNIYAPLP